MLAYLGSFLVMGIAGQIFFLGFGTEHLTFYQLLLFGLGLSRTRESDELESAPETVRDEFPAFGERPPASPFAGVGAGTDPLPTWRPPE